MFVYTPIVLCTVFILNQCLAFPKPAEIEIQIAKREKYLTPERLEAKRSVNQLSPLKANPSERNFQDLLNPVAIPEIVDNAKILARSPDFRSRSSDSHSSSSRSSSSRSSSEEHFALRIAKKSIKEANNDAGSTEQ